MPADPGAFNYVAVALHALFTQGLLLDAVTGEVAMLDPRVKHAAYVELPALPHWPPRHAAVAAATAGAAGAGLPPASGAASHGPGEDVVPSHHPWLNFTRPGDQPVRNAPGLPVLNLARTGDHAVHNASVPFDIEDVAKTHDGEQIRDALAILSTLMEPAQVASGLTVTGVAPTSPLLTLFSTAFRSFGVGVEDKEAAQKRNLETLHRLWARPECAGIPHTKLARRRFLHLWVNRTNFMHGCYTRYSDFKRNGWVLVSYYSIACIWFLTTLAHSILCFMQKE